LSAIETGLAARLVLAGADLAGVDLVLAVPVFAVMKTNRFRYGRLAAGYHSAMTILLGLAQLGAAWRRDNA